MIAAALISGAAFAQEESIAYKNDATVQAFGAFVKTTNENRIQQSATNSAGVLATYRFFFNDHNGVEVNYGYSQNTQNYTGVGGVDSRSHEVSAAYVLRFPMKRWTPFVLAGAGGLVFQPNNFSGADTEARAAGIYGGGADINLSQHIFVRAEYRGLIYNSPTFGLTALGGVERIGSRTVPSLRLASVTASETRERRDSRGQRSGNRISVGTDWCRAWFFAKAQERTRR
jgi:opacity protein-like surface antigen